MIAPRSPITEAPIADRSRERTAALPGWLNHYNYRRPQAAPATSPRSTGYSD
jgi:hypothetical protein